MKCNKSHSNEQFKGRKRKNNNEKKATIQLKIGFSSADKKVLSVSNVVENRSNPFN